jgi:hypothetical protein
LGTHWEHVGKKGKMKKILPFPPPFGQSIWDESVVLLGTSWGADQEVEEHDGNTIIGNLRECNTNTKM